ncbi:WD-40 repeat protein [Reticulomyxa filosa]|uniref:WD-40 repeat protein n=1 Tax=Reticulomyxa filosa TaxID=46433 RepID=X6P783_RETFI|nr:WD-40 repeat protein [Reticulomyxa filosa]|eukprot:ETO33497.1 WD-40 repeat protein [Reticulomyxa filosa]
MQLKKMLKRIKSKRKKIEQSKNLNLHIIQIVLAIPFTDKKINLSEEEEIKAILKYWIRILNIKLGWIQDFDKFVVNYVTFSFLFCIMKNIYLLFMNIIQIDHSTFDGDQFICSGSSDNAVCIWDIDYNKQIRSFNGHLNSVYCVKFSPYHYYNHRQNVICSSSFDKTIRFWDINDSRQSQIFNRHTDGICCIELSPFNGGRYLCSGSGDKAICLWDVETSKSLHIFNGHKHFVWCVDISPIQSNNNNDNKSNHIGVIGGNGYTICSGSFDNTIRIWDVETAKQSVAFEGHGHWIRSVKYGSNELGMIDGPNTILSGSGDKSVRLWDIRSGQLIQLFNGHAGPVNAVEYSPFVVCGNSNVICSASRDSTIRFWDIRSNKNELYLIDGDDNEDGEITCLKFLQLRTNRKINNGRECGVKLCYGTVNGVIRMWG